MEDEKLDEHANSENENLDDHANIAVINVNDDELISIDNPGELRNEENDLIEIVNDIEIASETNDQAIEVIVIVETGSVDEPSKTMKNCEIINIENGSEVVKVKMRKCIMCDFEANTGSAIKRHKESAHNWCSLCFSNFKSNDILKKHIEDKHTAK